MITINVPAATVTRATLGAADIIVFDGGATGAVLTWDAGATTKVAWKRAIGLGEATPATVGMIAATLGANGVTGIRIKRFTDTAPTGNFLDFQNAAGTSLLKVTVDGQITSTLATGTPPLVVASTTQVANLYAARAAVADVATANANLTGPITSVGNATSIASQTGTGTTFVMRTSPNLITPDLGAATGISVALTPAAASIGRGFTVTQSGPTSGVSTPHDAFGVHFNHILITSDQTNLANAASSVNGLFLYYAVGGANTKGQRNGIFAYVQKVGGSAVGGDTVGVGSFAIATATDGGTDTGAGARGAMFGGGFNGDLQSGATNYYLVSGAEITAAIAAGASARYMFGISLVNRGTVHAAGLEAALEIGAVAAGWNNGILFSNIHTVAPVSTTGTVLGTDGSSVTVANWANFLTYTVTGFILRFPTFSVTGAGVLTASVVAVSGTAGAVQLGARNTGSSFIDYADADIRHFFSTAAGGDAAALTSAGAFSAKGISLAAAANTTPITVTGYSVTGSGTAPLASFAGTWNTSGSPIAILLDVTNTTAGASAMLMALRIGGVARAEISKDGLYTSSGVGAGVQYTPRATGAAFLTYVDANAFHFFSGAADVVTISNAGAIGVGLTAAYRVDIKAPTNDGFRITDSTGAQYRIYLFNAGDTNGELRMYSGSSVLITTLNTTGLITPVVDVTTAYKVNGTVGVSVGPLTSVTSIQTIGGIVTTLAGAASDMRLKEHWDPFVGGRAALRAIQPGYFDWGDFAQSHGHPRGRQLGFSGQEWRAVVPETVAEETWGGDQWLAIRDRAVLAVTVGAFKEMDDDVAAIKAEIGRLTARLTDLESRRN